MFTLSAFPVPLSYTTLNTEPQQLPNFLITIKVHSHFGHFCVPETAVVSPVVQCTCVTSCAEASES